MVDDELDAHLADPARDWAGDVIARTAAGVVGGLAVALLEPGGWLLCCANTHRLSVAQFEKDVFAGIRAKRRRVSSSEAPPMPPEFGGDDYLKTLRIVVE